MRADDTVKNEDVEENNILITNEDSTNNTSTDSVEEDNKLSLKFNEFNNVNDNGVIEDIPATFPEASDSTYDNYDEDDEDKIQIGETLDTNNMMFEDLSEPTEVLKEDPLLDDIEILA